MKYLYLLLLIILLGSCEEQPVVIPELSNECSDKVLLIEELTGVSCPNCPKGTAALNELLDIFPGTIIAYAVHGSFLAEPKSTSKYDFRSEQGKEMEDFLRPFQGKPAASIDRFEFVDFQDGTITEAIVNRWLGLVEDRCQTPQSIDIRIESEYDEETRTADITVTTTGILPVEGEIRMNIVIAENGLIDPQDAGSQGVIEEYEHNHVMKDKLSNLTGDFLVSDLSVGQEVVKSYSYIVPDMDQGEWNPDNMEVVAFVTEGGQERGPVIHAAQEHLK